MGHKSKFTFPVPGRKSKEPPTISAPLTKVQKILGTGQINIDSLTVPNNNSRQWDTRSTGGISISVSESSISQATNDNGYGIVEDRDNGDRAGRSHGQRSWEQESAIIPRILRNGHRSNDRTLSGKKSTSAISADYLDVTTDSSSIRRQHSSSTIHSYYEKANVPLSVSQQTSNSAIARGLPPKAKALLDVEGIHINRTDSKKKKPPKLDLLMLTGRHRRQHQQQQQQQPYQPPEVEPVLGNNYVMKSPSLVSPSFEEPMQSYETTHYSSKRNTKLLPMDATAPSLKSMGPNRLRASSDTTHQLYDHYEQMLARDEPSPDVERSESPLESTICGSSPISSPPFFAPLAAPSKHVVRKRSENWSHTRKPSKESDISMFSSLAAAIQPPDPTGTKKDYASSISSRYTRTSKASRTDKSLLESDRQMTSVLSLSDSDSDEDAALSATRSSPFSQRSLPEVPHTSTPAHRPSSSRQAATEPRSSNRSQTDYSQLSDYLAIPRSASKLENTRVPSSSTIRSNHSSTSTVLPFHATTSQPSLEPSCFPDRSTRLSDGSSLHNQLRDSDCTVREAKAISLRPLVSTTEAPSWVPSTDTTSGHHTTPPQPLGNRTSRYSRSSDQPTPPMSPLSSKSVEIYLQSPEPPTEEPAAGTSNSNSNSSSQPDKSRFMAVTKQEEMLLAALRNKRAMMRDSTVPEIGGDGKGTDGGDGYRGADDILGTGKVPSKTPPQLQNPRSMLQVPSTGPGGRQQQQPPKSVPKRRSSLMSAKTDLGTSTFASSSQRLLQEQLRGLRSASSASSARPKTAGERSTSSSQESGLVESRSSRMRAPRDRVLMYLEHAPNSQGLNELGSPSASDPGVGSREIADMIDELSGEEYSRSECGRRGGAGEDRSQSRTASNPSESGSGSGSGSGNGRGYGAIEKRDEHRRHHHQHQHQHQQHEQKQPQRIRSNSNPRSDGLTSPPATSTSTSTSTSHQQQRLQIVPEDKDEHDVDDDLDGDGDEDGDEDDESEIDFDAFPAPATHSSVFGSLTMKNQEDEEQRNGKGKEPEKEKQKEDPRPFSPAMVTLQQQHYQRSDTPTSGGRRSATPTSGTPSGAHHVRGKKSAVRLSAVGRKNSLLLPWLGDDD